MFTNVHPCACPLSTIQVVKPRQRKCADAVRHNTDNYRKQFWTPTACSMAWLSRNPALARTLPLNCGKDQEHRGELLLDVDVVDDDSPQCHYPCWCCAQKVVPTTTTTEVKMLLRTTNENKKRSHHLQQRWFYALRTSRPAPRLRRRLVGAAAAPLETPSAPFGAFRRVTAWHWRALPLTRRAVEGEKKKRKTPKKWPKKCEKRVEKVTKVHKQAKKGTHNKSLHRPSTVALLILFSHLKSKL